MNTITAKSLTLYTMNYLNFFMYLMYNFKYFCKNHLVCIYTVVMGNNKKISMQKQGKMLLLNNLFKLEENNIISIHFNNSIKYFQNFTKLLCPN